MSHSYRHDSSARPVYPPPGSYPPPAASAYPSGTLGAWPDASGGGGHSFYSATLSTLGPLGTPGDTSIMSLYPQASPYAAPPYVQGPAFGVGAAAYPAASPYAPSPLGAGLVQGGMPGMASAIPTAGGSPWMSPPTHGAMGGSGVGFSPLIGSNVCPPAFPAAAAAGGSNPWGASASEAPTVHSSLKKGDGDTDFGLFD